MIETEEQWEALKAALKKANPELKPDELNDAALAVGDTPTRDQETGKLIARMSGGRVLLLNLPEEGMA